LLPLSNAKTHKRREKIEHTCFFVPVTLLVKNAGLQAATASWQASKSLTLQSRDTHVGKERESGETQYAPHHCKLFPTCPELVHNIEICKHLHMQYTDCVAFQYSRQQSLAKCISYEGEILDLGAKHHLLKLSGS
jgi:hypothetical protein